MDPEVASVENPSIPRLQERLKNLQAWLDNPEYQHYLANTRQQILDVKENIFRTPPIDPAATARNLGFYGQLDLLSDNLRLFEDARDILEQQLSILLDEATKITPTQTED